MLINLADLLNKRNFVIIIINVIFFSPLIIFNDFFINSLQYINSEGIERITFSIYKVVDLYSIILIYITPIFFLYFNFNNLKKILKNNFIKIIIFTFIYLILFWNYPNDDLLSGGAIRKVLNILITDQFYFKLFYLTLSGLSLLMVFYFAIKMERILLFMIIPYSFFYLFINYIFQEYLDPLFLIFLILYSKNFLEKCKKKVIFLFSYFLLFLLSAFIYRLILI